jgi:hypothetical protein
MTYTDMLITLPTYFLKKKFLEKTDSDKANSNFKVSLA